MVASIPLDQDGSEAPRSVKTLPKPAGAGQQGLDNPVATAQWGSPPFSTPSMPPERRHRCPPHRTVQPLQRKLPSPPCFSSQQPDTWQLSAQPGSGEICGSASGEGGSRLLMLLSKETWRGLEERRGCRQASPEHLITVTFTHHLKAA